VLTDFIHSVGVSSSFAFHDVYGLDEELLMMLPQPVQAMVLLFPSADAVRSEIGRAHV
jgi:ubiquitin carboxyl-terminal hydrolase L3